MASIEDLMNQINNDVDLETFVVDDDDFGGRRAKGNTQPISFKPTKNERDGLEIATNSDGQEYVVTGITLDFSEDDDFNQNFKKSHFPAMKHMDDEEVVSSKVLNYDDQQNPGQATNDVDMETFVSEDDDDFGWHTDESTRFLDDDDDDKHLVTEDMLEEKRKKKKISTGEVEDNYWAMLSKKHQKTNVKGSAGWHERVGSFDPEKEMELLNHDLTPQGSPIKNNTVVGSVETDFDYGDISADAEAGADAGAEGGADAGGMGESIDSKKYTKLFESLMDLVGFKVNKLNENEYFVKDLYNPKNTFKTVSVQDVIKNLTPYINDCVILVLQDSTGKKLTSYKDWCKWYGDKERKLFPNHRKEIEYCDLLENHIDNIVL